MLRLLHTADVHLGARHADLGGAASAQRERQFAAFAASVDLALAEKVDAFLVAGDLFDSNVQPRRSIERVAAELGRLVSARIRTVMVPGTHDVYDRASVYRAYDLAALAGAPAGGEKRVGVEERVVGRTAFERIEVDAASLESQPALISRLRAAATPDTVLDVRLVGVRPDELDVDVAEVEEALRPATLRIRVRDHSVPPLTEGTLPPAQTIAGAFIRNVEGRIAALEGSPDTAAAREAEELRDVLRLGRLLLAGREVTL